MLQQSATAQKKLDISSCKEVFLKKLNQIVLKNIKSEDLNIELLAQKMAISRSQLHRNLKKFTRLSASNYVRRFRLKIASKLLTKPINSISQIAYKVGIYNLSYFSKSFKEEFGKTPIEFYEFHNQQNKHFFRANKNY
ncbi:MAG: helix-turn-helix transcriptional regulator [Chitinophagales bacterium]